MCTFFPLVFSLKICADRIEQGNLMKSPDREFLLGELLKNVSRSFYLTLRVLPSGLREPIGLAYLLARAADTIADTTLVLPKHRIELLISLRSQVNGIQADAPGVTHIKSEVTYQQSDTHERTLLDALATAIHLLNDLSDDDRNAVRNVVSMLTTGMEFDLHTFPDERSGQIIALCTRNDLDHYTYLVAGCVGEFWTTISRAHCPELKAWDVAEMSRLGVRFGKALQLTNILRDCAKDLRMGRCYLPTECLDPFGLKPEDLLKAEHSIATKPLLCDLVRDTLDHYRDALSYTLAIPKRCGRLRLACIWPILIGLETLELHVRNDAWLDPAGVSKITRKDVYRIVACSLPIAGSNALVKAWIERKIRNVAAQLGDTAITNCPTGRSRIA